ncbi:MAG: recombinase family protein [Campylobacterales bacterium]|jgi:DNA invertase Pin-like site-specific DNA recombinase|nr:recombinase family protein [Campylobacterales bacterium]
MIFSYIRADSHFHGVYEQLKVISAYAKKHDLVIEDEMVDQLSQNSRLSERDEAVRFMRQPEHIGGTLLIYDLWVLSSNLEDVVQMLSCLLKNGIELHLIKPSIVLNAQSDIIVAMGMVDQLRQTIQSVEKKVIGRPRGSRSSSKFDPYLEVIIGSLREGQSVSEIARVLDVSRSSLKDYIESRELKEVAMGSSFLENVDNAEASIIETIECPQVNEKE